MSKTILLDNQQSFKVLCFEKALETERDFKLAEDNKVITIQNMNYSKNGQKNKDVQF
jgi:hypothetical protein